MNIVKFSLISFACLFAAAGATSSGCSEAKHAYDCDQICNKYKDCFDANYDTGACTDCCRSHADDDEDYGQRAEDCQDCAEDKACSGTFSCIDECIGIVP